MMTGPSLATQAPLLATALLLLSAQPAAALGPYDLLGYAFDQVGHGAATVGDETGLSDYLPKIHYQHDENGTLIEACEPDFVGGPLPPAGLRQPDTRNGVYVYVPVLFPSNEYPFLNSQLSSGNLGAGYKTDGNCPETAGW